MQSRLKSRKACALCHERKIRCDGSTPSCRNCLRAQVPCRPHERRRRVTESRQAEPDGRPSEATERLAWLEHEIHRVLKVDIHLVRTGTPLDFLSQAGFERGGENISASISNVTPSHTPHYHPSREQEEDRFERIHEVDPDISLLALNATGEVRYLGASSGSFFAKYIANVARSFASDRKGFGLSAESREIPLSSSSDRVTPALTPSQWRISETFPFLLRCYRRWVNSMYPLFTPSYFTSLETMSNSHNMPQEMSDTTIIFYLVMSIGAIHAEQPHLLKELGGDENIAAYQSASAQGLSAEALYWKAMNVLESQIKGLAPRISLVQILNLISIYASHRPSDNKQWHVGGMAMRLAIELGLHRHNASWKLAPDDLDLRRRVFWTTYAIEITLAFNLGRPASISFEDADAPFPEETEETLMPVHHIRHRQIQEHMLAQVYRGRKANSIIAVDADKRILDRLQDQLDHWHRDLHELYQKSSSPYPVEYWDRLYYATSAALSRPTPLIPRPGPQSHERCFISSGKVIGIHYKLIRQFNLPNSWMLLQGLILSAVSMIVTARNNAHILMRTMGAESILDKITKWVRKVSVVLAIMRERWVAFATNDLEDLLDRISQDTVRRIIGLMRNEALCLPAQTGSEQDTAQAAAASLTSLRQNQTHSFSLSSSPMEHLQYNVTHSSGALMDHSAEQHALNTPDPTITTGFPEFDSNEIWQSFDNLFETSELQTFFGVFSGQQYI